MENQAMALLESGKRLTADEEVIVFRYYHEHTTPEMRNQIALNNLGLVHSVINNYTYKERYTVREKDDTSTRRLSI